MMQVVCFFGADSKTGTTMTCQAVAEELAENYPSKKILQLHLDGHPGTDFSDIQYIRCLDDIKAALSSEVLTLSELEEACGKDRNMFTLAGTLSLTERKKYLEEHVRKLLALARSGFDLILVDAGSSIDMGLSIGALRYSDYQLLVTTQQRGSLNQYQEADLQVLSKLEVVFQGMIVNKFVYNMRTFLPQEKELKSAFGIDRYFEIPQLEYGWQAEAERNSLLKFKDKWYKKSIQEIADMIGELAGFKESHSNTQPKKGRFILSLIGGKLR